MKLRADLAALGLAALIVVAMTVCQLEHVPSPGVFETLATIAVSAGVGIAAPSMFAQSSSSSSPSSSTEETAAAAAPPAAAAHVGTTSDPATTGVFRAVPGA